MSTDSSRQPAQLDTMRTFEQGDDRYRVYLTVGGAIAVERWNERLGEWAHMPLCEAAESDIADLLRARYAGQDEEIARVLSSYGS